MYAILESGGKQYRAEAGTVLRLEKLPNEVGDRVNLEQVLLVADGHRVRVGQPFLDDVVIHGRVVEQGRHRKILVFKHKRRKDYRKKQGHRQYYTAVLIEGIDEQQSGEAAPRELETKQAPAENLVREPEGVVETSLAKPAEPEDE